MSDPERRGGRPHPLTGLLVVCGVAILLATLLPLEFSADAEQVRIKWERLTDFGRTGSSWPDIIANHLLFLPLGALLAGRLLTAGARLVAVVALTLLCGFGLSLLIELTQLFIVGRLASWIDLVMNTSGALAGSVVGWLWFRAWGAGRRRTGASG